MNPLGLTYSALWDLVLSHPEFAALPKGNLIRFDSKDDSDPLSAKKNLSAADTPELLLTIDATTTNIRNTSSSSLLTRSFAWQVSSGDLRYTEKMAHLEWALFCAMCDWPAKLCSLQWKEKGFVKAARIVGVQTGISNTELNRNIKGWAAIWRIEVDMYFQTSDLLQALSC